MEELLRRDQIRKLVQDKTKKIRDPALSLLVSSMRRYLEEYESLNREVMRLKEELNRKQMDLLSARGRVSGIEQVIDTRLQAIEDESEIQ